MPSSSKHQRGGSESEGAESSSVKAAKKIKTNLHADPTQSNSPSHATFWDLPTELRTTILDLASQKPNSAAYGGSRLRLDRKTIHSLTLVSRQFHSTFNPVLYSHVKLTKPSILAEFRQSLFEKPSLGGMVKSLHLGPLSEMREGWWPVRFKNPSRESGLDDTINLLKTSLTNRDEKRRPRWCKPGKEWAYDMPARTCYASAVGRAIRAALEGVGLKLLDPDYGEVDFADAKGSSLGINKWTVRVYEVQAVLDLYLGEMRRVEDEEKRPVPSWRWKAPSTTPKAPETCRNGKCGHYPRLVLEGFEGNKQAKAKDVRDSSATVQDATTQSANGPTSQEQSASAKGEQTVFVVTQAQATEHCARRGAHTDHFDSPFIFASSDLKMLSRDSQRRIIVEHDEYEGRDYYYSDYDELDSDYEGPVFPYNDDEFSQPESPTSRSPRSSSVASTPLEPLTSPPPEIFDRTRRNDLLSLARSVINLALGLRTLSVTGWLSRCLDRKAPDLSNLNSLSLGPILPPRSTYDAIYEVPLPNLSKLRFAGHELCSWAVERFSKEESKLPNLRRFEWEYGGSKLTRPFGRSLEVVALRVISKLQGVSTPAIEGATSSDSDQGEAEGPGSANDTASKEHADQSSGGRYVELRLHPDTIAAILKSAPNTESRAAWSNGSALPGAQYRVRLVESRAAIINESGSDSSEQDLNVLRRESERWWEERALEIERGELLDGSK